MNVLRHQNSQGNFRLNLLVTAKRVASTLGSHGVNIVRLHSMWKQCRKMDVTCWVDDVLVRYQHGWCGGWTLKTRVSFIRPGPTATAARHDTRRGCCRLWLSVHATFAVLASTAGHYHTYFSLCDSLDSLLIARKRCEREAKLKSVRPPPRP